MPAEFSSPDSSHAEPCGEADSSAHDAAVGEVPLEVLEQQLTSWAAHIAAAEAQWLAWLGEYDRRQGWAEWGCASTAHWLSWKCGMTPSVARERVRVAAALPDLPLIQHAFGQGRLSYSKVRALTRVANRFNEPELCDMALHASGAQLEAICRGYRRSHPDQTTETESAHQRRRYTVRENHDGTTTITLVLIADEARLVDDNVHAEADRIITEALGTADGEASVTRRKVIETRDGIAAIRADACAQLLIGMGEATMPRPSDLTMVIQPHHHDGRTPSDVPAPESDVKASDDSAEATVLVTTDLSAETDAVAAAFGADTFTLVQNGTPVAAESGRRLCCDPRITALIESATGEPLAVGRTTRLISHHLRLALMRRDGGRCQFPGCCTTRNLHAHHVIHWADGGPTELDNLVLVCHFHHHLIHDRNWTVDPATRRFASPKSRPVDYRPVGADLGGDPALIEPAKWRGAHDDRPACLEPPHLDPLDLGLATEILHANEEARTRYHAIS